MESTTISVDTGGTFTDAFVVHAGQAHTAKVLTTPHDLALCFRQVIEKAAAGIGLPVGQLLRRTTCVRYATTVGTNAVIQRTGPRLGLLAASKSAGASAHGRFLEPDMVEPVDGHEDDVVAAAKRLLSQSARGLVCALPDAHEDPAREQAIRAHFEAHYPKHCLDAVPLLLSSEIDADPDDARRTATALFNAYVHPDVARYLYRAEDWLRDSGYNRPLLIVHNDGGCARVAKTVAGKTYNSGPMAGLMGAEQVAALYGVKTLLALDMGGTSLDVAFVRDGVAPIAEHGRVEDVEISFPLAEVLAMGAGGGSIAHLEDGRLKVGPQSAGAKPGPACFGFGGTEPTTTDADVVLGIIDPEQFLGGAMQLDAQRAYDALGTLGDPVQTAQQVRATLHDEMAQRIRAAADGRGVDLAQTTILAYGGAGATHAAGFAERLGVNEIVTLPFSAVFSAFGASSADVVHTYLGVPGSEQALHRRALRDMRGEGFAEDAVAVTVEDATRHGAAAARVQATARLDHFPFTSTSVNGSSPIQPRGARTVHWPEAIETAIYASTDLHAGHRIEGPAVVEAADTTIAVPPAWSFRIDEYGHGRMERSK